MPSIRTVVASDIVFSGVHFGVPKNDISVIAFMKKYMQDWDAAVAVSKNADELKARMNKLYPTWAWRIS